MTTIAEALGTARRFHLAGQWDAAERILQPLVQSVPECGEAWYRLGMIALQRGQRADAVERLTRAAAVDPQNAIVHCSLGAALGSQGRLTEAVLSFRQALACQPDYPEAHLNLGATLQQQGDLAGAAEEFGRAAQLRPQYAQAFHHRGAVLKLLGRLDEAAACFRRAAECHPDYPEAFYGLGVVLQQQGRPDAAVPQFQRAIQLRPQYAEAHNNLGTALQELGRLPEAAACFQRVIELQPTNAAAYNNRGAVSWCQGQTAAAIDCFRQALKLRPDYAEAYNNWGLAAEDRRQPAEAAEVLDRAVQLAPDFAEAHMHRAMIWLQHGDFARGWREYEWRFRMPDFAPRVTACPMWDGAPLAGRTLLIYSEGGLGDAIQFVRYAAVARRSGGTVILSCPRALVPLLQSCSDVSQVIADSEPLPPCDVFAPLLSLPRMLGTTLADVPADIPYLSAASTLVGHWRERLPSDAGINIGIVWQGQVKHRDNACRYRAAPPAALASLAAVPGVRLISLQKGAGTEELPAVASRFPVLTLPGLDEATGPFLDTAAVMMNLDLVVTVDTAIAHLAGALGVPVWVALPFAAEWRWLLDREDTPWYPTMRLFRQRTPGDWDDVFQRMAAAVKPRLKKEGIANPEY